MFSSVLISSIFIQLATALVASPTPVITPAPVKRAEWKTWGYTSAEEKDGTTRYAPVTYDAASLSLTTSREFLGFCESGAYCLLATSCSGSYVMFDAASATCQGTCGYDTIFNSLGASSPQTRVRCDSTGLGQTVYKASPTNGLPPISLSSKASAATSATSTSQSSSETATPKKASNIGIIVGAAIGGVVLLCAIVLGVLFLIKRRRSASANTGGGAVPEDNDTEPFTYSTLPEKAPDTTSYVMDTLPPKGTEPTSFVSNNYPSTYPSTYQTPAELASPVVHTGFVSELPSQRL